MCSSILIDLKKYLLCYVSGTILRTILVSSDKGFPNPNQMNILLARVGGSQNPQKIKHSRILVNAMEKMRWWGDVIGQGDHGKLYMAFYKFLLRNFSRIQQSIESTYHPASKMFLTKYFEVIYRHTSFFKYFSNLGKTRAFSYLTQHYKYTEHKKYFLNVKFLHHINIRRRKGVVTHSHLFATACTITR